MGFKVTVVNGCHTVFGSELSCKLRLVLRAVAAFLFLGFLLFLVLFRQVSCFFSRVSCCKFHAWFHVFVPDSVQADWMFHESNSNCCSFAGT